MTETVGTIRVLHVATDPDFAEWVETAGAAGERLSVEVAGSASEGQQRLATADVDCVVSAYELPDGNGVDLLEAVRATHPDLPFVLFTDAGSEAVASEAISAGVTDYLRNTGETDQFRALAERIEAVVETTDEESEGPPWPDVRSRAMDEAPVGAVITDPSRSDNPIIYVNDVFEEMTGYSEAETLGRNCRFLQGDDTAPEPVTAMRTAIDDEEPVTVELRNYREDGSAFWNRVTIAPLRNDTGDVTHFVGFQEDVTDRKERERERAATIELLQDLYDVTTDTDLAFEAKISRLLELGCRRLGLPYGFLSNIEPADDGDDDGVQRIVHAEGDHELLQPGKACPLSRAYCRKTIETDGLLAIADAVEAGWDGDPAYETFDLGSYIGGKVTIDGDLYGTLCFAATAPGEKPFTTAERTLVRLMSKWVSYELERERTQRELQHQNDRLDQFASVVSHDLRNPLNVANLNLELAAAECETDHLATVDDALTRMDDIIDDALLLAREGRAVEETEWVWLADQAERCWEHCVTGGSALVVENDLAFAADPDRVARLLENLFRNSIEHNPDGVTVTVGALDDDGFFVADDGTGIPAPDDEDVFASGYSTSDDGTGLGLAIVKEIADAHGWTVTLADGDGGGARFEFRGVSTRAAD